MKKHHYVYTDGEDQHSLTAMGSEARAVSPPVDEDVRTTVAGMYSNSLLKPFSHSRELSYNTLRWFALTHFQHIGIVEFIIR